MRILSSLTIGLLLLVPAGIVSAQASGSASGGGVPVTQLIGAVSKKTSKRFLVDPRVQANVTLIGQEPGNISYNDLLSILQVHGFAAVETGGYVRIVPDAMIRTTAVPTLTGRDDAPAAQYVSKVISVKSLSAAYLVPILRPLVPQQGHLAAIPCKNVLTIVDTYDNVKRLEALVASIDQGPAFTPEPCAPPSKASAD